MGSKTKSNTEIFEPTNIGIIVAACVVSFIVAIVTGGNNKSEQEALEKAKNELKNVENNLTIANADIENLKMKINTLENIDIKKLKSKLAAIRQDLIAHDGKLDSQWKQHLTTQERLEQELKTKSEQVDNMEQVLLNLEAHGELTEHGWETIPPQKT